ncbi:DNA segregation ATPase FtsK/SpoIIIE, S-DNA-T family [Amycolatopsis xylanica]|uniref:DNA segregation ATPase FtsK/SpoIIIE, S-DNA-T family n=1 Tax=Amycolatopsis xylanica TaxID=589385 RepID=A0A1H3QCR5_9PSEU|nr:type VII secretion protein EccCa [Amycolatopsis xylanica]SDZ10868.1 DNA segregation ATPase FtsK/SpoIIIE, S-DNA-T family [Amycolatopsis xylanica]
MSQRLPMIGEQPAEIVLQSPPMIPKGGSGGMLQLLMFLPMMLGMGAMSFVYIGRDGGAMTWIFGGLFVVVMGGMVVMSLGRGGAAKKAAVNEERRDYQRYLAGLRGQVREIADDQRAEMISLQPDPADLWAYVEAGKLWDRRRSAPQFGQIRVGTGPQRLITPLRAPQTVPLEDLDPVSSTSLKHFIRTYSTVNDLPVAISLRSFAAVYLSGRRPDTLGLTRALLAQLVTFHSPTDLRIALCVAGNRLHDWEWAKWLPHATASTAADAAGPRRLVADNVKTLGELLGNDLGERPAFSRKGQSTDHPHIVVIVDGGQTYGEPRLITETGHLGITVLDVGTEQPRASSTEQILCLHSGPGQLGMVVGEGNDVRLGFLGKPDALDRGSAEALARMLTPLYQGTAVVSETPMSATFGLAALLGIGDPRDTDTAVTWAPRAPRDRLRIPLGVNPEGRPVELDLKESAEGGMGPHGLVIGATGSGKSELLRTLVVGLAVTHSSEKLNLALIDFKGGATFAGMTGLPHTCAVITNLSDDLSLVDRMADAINGEVLRRQELLHAAGNYASVRDYERARESGVNLKPLPSLLVIIDEFSELLSSRPEFIDLFVTIGRLGRSLGIHLLLASQRLEEGRLRGLDSHLSYRIGLRTFSAQESRAVLGVADAYQLPSVPGSAYLKVDTDTLIRLKAAYVSGDLPPRNLVAAAAAKNSNVLPFTLAPVELPAEIPAMIAAEESTVSTSDSPTETIMSAMVSRLEGKGPEAHQIWLPPLQEPPTLDQLLPPLGIDPERGLCPLGWGGNGRLTIPVALVDKPFEQRRDMLWADFASAGGHALIVGAPQSGKSILMRTIAGMLALTHTPREVQLFILDMGGGALAPLSGLPHTSGYATRRDAQRCRRVVAELTTLLEQREEFFAAHGIESIATFRERRADFTESREGREFGDVFLFVDNWTTIRQEYEKLEEQITALAQRGLGFGIHVIISLNQWMGIRAPLRDAIGTRFELRLGDPADSIIDRKTAQNVPADAPGRGLTADKLHFLGALPRVDSDQRPATIGDGGVDLVERLSLAWQGMRAPQVRLLPAEIPLDSLPAAPGKQVLLGIAESNLGPVALDFGSDPHFLAFGDVESGKSSLLRALAQGIMTAYTPDEAAIVVADYRRGLLDAVTGRHLLGYAGSETVLTGLIKECEQAMRGRLPGPDVTAEQLRNRSWWKGPELFILVDDYELVAQVGRNPLLPLLEFLPQARDIGLHIILARGAGGAGRALFEPVLQRIRELGSPGLVMAGSKDEGVLLGDVKPGPQPPGRGTLVSRRHGTGLIQIAWTKPADS